MKRVKLIYIFSFVQKSLQLEWMIKDLDRERFDISIVLLGESPTPFGMYLQAIGLPVRQFRMNGKWEAMLNFFRIFFIVLRRRPNVVHTHLFYANFIGLTAAWLGGVKRRIYTRHHATIHVDNFPLAMKLDQWVNRIATHIVLPSEILREVLVRREGANPEKLVMIYHGFDLDAFRTSDLQKVTDLKVKYSMGDGSPVIGVIARHTEWKGVQYTIEAFRIFQINYPGAHLVLANAIGEYHGQIGELLKQLPEQSFTQIAFEPDSITLYHCFDIFVHVPVDPYCEAFGQTYVEALAAGIPSVFTLSGVAKEFVIDGHNALVVPFRDAASIADKMKLLMEGSALKSKLIANGFTSVEQKFSLGEMTEKLNKLYQVS